MAEEAAVHAALEAAHREGRAAERRAVERWLRESGYADLAEALEFEAHLERVPSE